MDIGIVGGSNNGLCCAWQLAKLGHKVQIYERDTLMKATSSASSKLLHDALRYLENREFRLVSEALRERDTWILRSPHLAKLLRLVMRIYHQLRRPGWMTALDIFLDDHLAGKSLLPKAKPLSAQELISRDSHLKSEGLQGGYEFSDSQMDDHALGLLVAEQAKQAGVNIAEHTEIGALIQDGRVIAADRAVRQHDRLINVAGPLAQRLLQESGIDSPHELDLVRGSQLLLYQPCKQTYLFEAPNYRSIFFVLPWQGNTVVGTTEVRQTLNEPIACSIEEHSYLLNAWTDYFPGTQPIVIGVFTGLRPLLRSAQDPTKATHVYAIHRTDRVITVFGDKWTTALALADKVTNAIH